TFTFLFDNPDDDIIEFLVEDTINFVAFIENNENPPFNQFPISIGVKLVIKI
ncbi:3110_t:CDS:1, partial [Dentiscutata heterogama]